MSSFIALGPQLQVCVLTVDCRICNLSYLEAQDMWQGRVGETDGLISTL